MNGYDTMIQDLQKLDPFEEAGKQHYLSNHTMLRYEQFIYLYTHQDEDVAPDLNSITALREQNAIADSFHKKYGRTGLTEEDFMSPGADIELEKLLRYIEIPSHFHRFVELSFVLRGTCIHKIRDDEIMQKEGEFILIPAMITHKLDAVGDALCFTIKIRIEAFQKLTVPNLPELSIPLRFQFGQDPAIVSMLLFLYQQQNCDLPYRKELMNSAMTSLLTYIMQKYHHTQLPLYHISIKDQQFLDIVNYMYENYTTITLASLAKHFHYNTSYLSRMFHEQGGRSFKETVRDFKLRKAAELLKTKDWKLEQICEEIGYKDTRQFIRSFKQMFGTTPNSYRKMNRP